MTLLLAATAAALLPALHSGERLTLDVPGWGRGIGTGGAVWPAAGALCRWLRKERREVAGTAVLELGSGTGAVGLFAVGCGAQSLVLTDLDASLCSLAADNVRANRGSVVPVDTAVATRRYRWGSPVEALGGPFDLCLGSDITYEPGSHAALMKTLGLLLEAPAPPRVLLAHMHRPLTSVLKQGGCLEHLLATARRRGLSTREISIDRSGLSVVSLIEVSRAEGAARDEG